ncbi:Alpha/Beta hydrolase fold [Naviculisporaceae sp. PSN 640]
MGKRQDSENRNRNQNQNQSHYQSSIYPPAEKSEHANDDPGQVQPPPQEMMDLGPVFYLDCIVFCALLAPQLLWHVGLFEICLCVWQMLPFLLFKLPASFIFERYILQFKRRPAFIKKASPFEDFVIRCVRHAFANLPPRIGRVFFSKQVALPFLRFRLLRHGYLHWPISWREHHGPGFHGIWITRNPDEKPDFVLYYAHGGGFSMGSSHFYLEFLLTWLSTLVQAGYRNPAIFALDYTLVPDAAFPVQLEETIRGYNHVLAVAGDHSRVCVSGDSAGALLILSLLLHLGGGNSVNGVGQKDKPHPVPKPALAILISPWVTLVSTSHKNNPSDYLEVQHLHRYGLQFAGGRIPENNFLVSPGSCKDKSWWKRSRPLAGIFVTYGEEEVLAEDIEDWLQTLREAGVIVGTKRERGGIHAWPVASLFLSSNRSDRLDGLMTITEEIRKTYPIEQDGR